MQTILEEDIQQQQSLQSSQPKQLQIQQQLKLINLKSEKNNQLLNNLKNQYEQLKKTFESPRLFLSTYFADLRNEVDIAFLKMNQSEHGMEVKHKLNDAWFQMIEQINTFETECLKIRVSNSFNPEFTQEVREKIELIDIILNDLNNQVVVEEAKQAFSNELKSKDDEDNFNEVSNLIYEETYKIEKMLFLNQTMMFLDKTNWNDASLFDVMNTKTTFGKIYFVQNEYFGKQTLGYIKK